MSIPRYSRHVVGPSRLSSASGTPRAAQRETRVCKWYIGTLLCVGCSGDEEVVQVVVDGGDPPLSSYPLKSFGQTVKDKGG